MQLPISLPLYLYEHLRSFPRCNLLVENLHFLPAEVSFEALAKGVPLGPKAPKMVSTKHQSARDTQ